jgi:hypothetical protein
VGERTALIGKFHISFSLVFFFFPSCSLKEEERLAEGSDPCGFILLRRVRTIRLTEYRNRRA